MINVGDVLGRFDGYLIYTDFDGTLTDSKGMLSIENGNAIKNFQENEADREADSNNIRYTHDEVFSRVRARINVDR